MSDRIDAARDLHRRLGECAIESPEILDLIAYAEERCRVNAGLLAENAALKAKQRQPDDVDLLYLSDRDLLGEVQRRLDALRSA